MNSGGRSLAGREALRRWGPLAAAALLLALAAAGAAFGSLQIGRVQLPAAPEDGSPSGTSTTEAPQSDLPSPAPGRPSQLQVPAWLTTLVGVLCGLAVAAIVGLLLWYLIRTALEVRNRPLALGEGQPDRLAAQVREVAAAVDAGLADLSDTDTDPRRAVIACWVRLEDAAAAAGTRRRPGETPADLVGRLLAEHMVSRPVLDGFAAVYREARYATHVVDEQMRATAVSALRQVRAELTVQEPA